MLLPSTISTAINTAMPSPVLLLFNVAAMGSLLCACAFRHNLELSGMGALNANGYNGENRSLHDAANPFGSMSQGRQDVEDRPLHDADHLSMSSSMAQAYAQGSVQADIQDSVKHDKLNRLLVGTAPASPSPLVVPESTAEEVQKAAINQAWNICRRKKFQTATCLVGCFLKQFDVKGLQGFSDRSDLEPLCKFPVMIPSAKLNPQTFKATEEYPPGSDKVTVCATNGNSLKQEAADGTNLALEFYTWVVINIKDFQLLQGGSFGNKGKQTLQDQSTTTPFKTSAETKGWPASPPLCHTFTLACSWIDRPGKWSCKLNK